jgi:hypothetical protein
MATFTDSRFMPATEKRRVLAQWRRFLQMLARNYADKDRCFRAFPDALYRHLIQHCSFIAHYNRSGFFSRYFEHGDDTIRFLRQFDQQASPHGRSAEYRMPLWLEGEYADINEAMRDAAAECVSGIAAVATEDQKRSDLARTRYLTGRHGHSIRS